MVSSILQKVPGVTGPVTVSLDTDIASIPGKPNVSNSTSSSLSFKKVKECIDRLGEFDYTANELGIVLPTNSATLIEFNDSSDDEEEILSPSLRVMDDVRVPLRTDKTYGIYWV